jgi:predicted RNase H-like nuclease (RuvC/YqgF family)
MTDEMIVKALGCCSWQDEKCCEKCPLDKKETNTFCNVDLMQSALDLINRQKAEIEKLNDMLDRATDYEAETYNEYKEECATVEKLEMEIRMLRATTEQLNKKLDEMTLGDLLVFKIHKFIEAVKGAKDNGRNE